MKYHVLKTWPPHFGDTKYGNKRVEIRRNDRDFKVGDILILMEWVPDEEDKVSLSGLQERLHALGDGGHYTHETCPVLVTHIMENLPLGFGLQEGFCVMSIDLYTGPLPDVME